MNGDRVKRSKKRKKKKGEKWREARPTKFMDARIIESPPLPLMNFRAQFQSLRPGCAFTYARH